MFQETEKERAFREMGAIIAMKEAYETGKVITAAEMDVARYRIYAGQRIKELSRKLQVLTREEQEKKNAA